MSVLKNRLNAAYIVKGDLESLKAFQAEIKNHPELYLIYSTYSAEKLFVVGGGRG
ncbi:hypothetical protein GOV14_04200 [Candidatus Pacearchaeota archaeon]|nr:hypothetical protein [Candidatus Pacearchaeota archaeon]